MNIEKVLTRIFQTKLSCEMRGVNWKRSKQFRADLQDVYNRSDLTAGELCDALEIRMEVLSELLNAVDRPRVSSVWDQNLEKGLPLFVPVRLTGLT